jgi:hypothetical protein
MTRLRGAMTARYGVTPSVLYDDAVDDLVSYVVVLWTGPSIRRVVVMLV